MFVVFRRARSQTALRQLVTRTERPHPYQIPLDTDQDRTGLRWECVTQAILRFAWRCGGFVARSRQYFVCSQEIGKAERASRANRLTQWPRAGGRCSRGPRHGTSRSSGVSVSRAILSPMRSNWLAWITSRGMRPGTNRLASPSQNAARRTNHASLTMGRCSTMLGHGVSEWIKA
jgi:hypothetical protein